MSRGWMFQLIVYARASVQQTQRNKSGFSLDKIYKIPQSQKHTRGTLAASALRPFPDVDLAC